MSATRAARSTLAQVESEERLAVSTVSKVLNDRDDVAADTRQRVESALADQASTTRPRPAGHTRR